MSYNLKYIYLFSFVVIVITTVLAVTLGRNYIEKGIIKPSTSTINQVTAERFVETIWKRHRKTLQYLPCNLETQQRCPNTTLLSKELHDFFKELPLLSCGLYDAETEQNLLNEKRLSDNSPHSTVHTAFDQAASGNASHEMILDYSLGGTQYTVVHSLIPISMFHNDTQKQAVLSLVYDVTPIWSNANMTQMTIIAVTIGLFSIILGIMYILSAKTEKLFTKQYEANMELIKAKAEAETENKAKSQFLANISHELRTPLNAIIGFSEIIRDEVMGPLNNEQYKEYITDIHMSGVHLLSLINDILDYSKAEEGKLNVDMEDVDVNKVMKSCIRLVTPRANEAGVTIIGEIPKKHYILLTDGRRLKQVLLNLFSNAVKFTDKGGTITLYAWHNANDSTFVIEVQDTGVGIAPRDISRVMATFGQVENKLSRRYEGTGLGLPLSKKLVELMGGQIQIESELGKGTKVSIILPYMDPEGNNDEAAKRDALLNPEGTTQA